MSRRIITFIFVVGLVVTFLFHPQAKSNEVLGMPNFTVITRTHTPAPVPPTATRSDNGGGGNPTSPPPATETVVPATPTFIPVTLAATQEGGFIATAVACGFPPTVQAQNSTFIRLGPGADYDIMGQLIYLETRPIIGRAVDSEWWVILYTNDQIGWVADAVVNVHGNTSGVPLVAAPAINGGTPTPGPLWNPTPNPVCPVIPSATPTPTETAVDVVKEGSVTTDTPRPTTTEADAEATSVVPTAKTILVDVVSEDVQSTAEPLDPEEAPSAVTVLPCASAMIGLAVVGFIIFRRIF